MKKFSILSVLFLCATEVFAWGGNGRRPSNDPKIKAPTDSNTKAESPDGSVIVNAHFFNRQGDKEMVCDMMAQITGKRGGDETTVSAFEDKMTVKPYRNWVTKYLFEVREMGRGFKLDKKSQQFHASCLTLDPGEDPGQVPPPHTQCDPEIEDCDWTCKSSQSNPDQCSDPGQDW